MHRSTPPPPRRPAPSFVALGLAVVTVASALLVTSVVADRASAYPGAPWFQPSVPYTGNFPDPHIVRDGGTYHAYGTNTGGSLLPTMTSTDLVTWTPRPAYRPPACDNGDPYFNDALPCAPSWAARRAGDTSRYATNIMAPGVTRLPNGTWAAYYSVLAQVSPERWCISVATSSSPIGPFTDRSSGPIVCDADPAGSIDPAPFVDSDGSAWLLWKSNGIPGSTPTRLWSQRLAADGRSFAAGSSRNLLLATAESWEGNVIENPTMVRWGGTLWLGWSGNEWRSADYRFGLAACASPSGGCTRVSGPVIANRDGQLSRAGGNLFTDAAGRLRLSYHWWNAPYTDYPAYPACVGSGTCTTQGQRRMGTAALVRWGAGLTVDPVGSLDGAAAAANGSITVSGWALDPDRLTGATEVRVLVDGRVVATAAAGASRPDVGAAFPGFGDGHGYSVTVGGQGEGTRQVCVVAVAVAPTSTGDRTIGCRSVVVPTGSPFGSVDRVAPFLPGLVVLSGWVIDPDTAAPTEVHVYVDGSFAGAFPAAGSRPDVAAAFPGYGDAHGFGVILPAYGGTRSVCTYGINVGPGQNRLIGCRSVTMPGGSPFGSVDAASAAPGSVSVSGWVIDPDTVFATDVHVYVDGRFATARTAGGNRPDVGAAFPLYGGGHGFAVTVPAGPGSHQVCVYGINVGRGGNVLVGCRSVAVPSGSPFGSLDAASGGAGTVSLAGWAIDPDTVSPIDVHLYVDGGYAGAFRASAPRPDVGAAFPGYGDGHGFAITAPVSAGTRVACVYGINVGAGGNRLIGCRTVTIR